MTNKDVFVDILGLVDRVIDRNNASYHYHTTDEFRQYLKECARRLEGGIPLEKFSGEIGHESHPDHTL